jgi:tripartite-type tricarboxylate transporter receptor subunit TctC
MKNFISIVCAAAALAWAPGQALAQAYPTKPVKIVVPFGPGGFTDVVARILGVKLSESLGQPVVIENKPGAGSMIGTDQVAKSAPDGHTLLIVSSTHVISPWIYKNVPYDPIKGFTPVTKLVDSPYVLLTNPKVPVKNVQEFIAMAKANPDKVHYASSGNGSAQHLIGGLFASMTKTQLKHVPYRSSNLASTDLVAGVVESSFAGVPNALSQVPNGRLNALAVTSAKRIPQLPNVPTMQEAGVPGYDATIWLALLAPAGTPDTVIKTLNRVAVQSMKSADLRQQLLDVGVEPTFSTPSQFSDLIRADGVKWAEIVKKSGATID